MFLSGRRVRYLFGVGNVLPMTNPADRSLQSSEILGNLDFSASDSFCRGVSMQIRIGKQQQHLTNFFFINGVSLECDEIISRSQF